jgi:membrane protein implicated in regulation of membrane protease activity
MKARRISISSGKRVLIFTMILLFLSAVTIGLMLHYFGQLLKGFDVVALLIFAVSTYLTIVLLYSVVTIFYNVDKLSGRQKRTLRFLELRSPKEGEGK